MIISRLFLQTGKQGIHGEIVKLKCNFFNINLLKGFQVFQYAVEFTPLIERTVDKNYLINQHHGIFSTFIFHKASIYSANELKTLKLTSYTKDFNEVILNFTEIKLIWPSLHFLNLIFQQAICSLDLQLIGENFYDSSQMARNSFMTVEISCNLLFTNRLTFLMEIWNFGQVM